MNARGGLGAGWEPARPGLGRRERAREGVMVPVAVLSDLDRASRGAGKCLARSGVWWGPWWVCRS